MRQQAARGVSAAGGERPLMECTAARRLDPPLASRAGTAAARPARRDRGTAISSKVIDGNTTGMIPELISFKTSTARPPTDQQQHRRHQHAEESRQQLAEE